MWTATDGRLCSATRNSQASAIDIAESNKEGFHTFKLDFIPVPAMSIAVAYLPNGKNSGIKGGGKGDKQLIKPQPGPPRTPRQSEPTGIFLNNSRKITTYDNLFYQEQLIRELTP